MRRDWLIEARLRAGYTQGQFSKATGLTQPQVCQYENGAPISTRNAQRIAALLDVPWTRFFEEDLTNTLGRFEELNTPQSEENAQ